MITMQGITTDNKVFSLSWMYLIQRSILSQGLEIAMLKHL
jgi:hypothetical protein